MQHQKTTTNKQPRHNKHNLNQQRTTHTATTTTNKQEQHNTITL